MSAKTWYIIVLLIVVFLLTVLVVRVSEISTRMQTLEKYAQQMVTVDDMEMFVSDHTHSLVTHDQLRAVVHTNMTTGFTMGKTNL